MDGEVNFTFAPALEPRAWARISDCKPAANPNLIKTNSGFAGHRDILARQA
jgi:hypothetical protein